MAYVKIIVRSGINEIILEIPQGLDNKVIDMKKGHRANGTIERLKEVVIQMKELQK